MIGIELAKKRCKTWAGKAPKSTTIGYRAHNGLGAGGSDVGFLLWATWIRHRDALGGFRGVSVHLGWALDRLELGLPVTTSDDLIREMGQLLATADRSER